MCRPRKALGLLALLSLAAPRAAFAAWTAGTVTDPADRKSVGAPCSADIECLDRCREGYCTGPCVDGAGCDAASGGTLTGCAPEDIPYGDATAGNSKSVSLCGRRACADDSTCQAGEYCALVATETDLVLSCRSKLGPGLANGQDCAGDATTCASSYCPAPANVCADRGPIGASCTLDTDCLGRCMGGICTGPCTDAAFCDTVSAVC